MLQRGGGLLGWVGEALLEEICTARVIILLFEKRVLPWGYRVKVLITKKICCANEHGVVLYRDSNHRKISPLTRLMDLVPTLETTEKNQKLDMGQRKSCACRHLRREPHIQRARGGGIHGQRPVK